MRTGPRRSAPTRSPARRCSRPERTPALRAVLGKDVGYVGAIGSRKTNENRFAALREEGFTEEQIARVHGPVGLDLGGRGAEETALGILAEITAVRFGGSGSFMREARALR